MAKEIYTKEEVLELLVKERTRARDVAYEFMNEHERKKKNFTTLMQKDSSNSEYALYVIRKAEDLADECRRVGNAISGSNAISATLGETIEDRIKKEYNL